MPTIINLPARANAIQYDEDDVVSTADLLGDVAKGQGVAIDEAQESETKARSRAKAMQEALLRRDTPVHTRTHVVEMDDGTFVPALSIKATPAETDDEAAA